MRIKIVMIYDVMCMYTCMCMHLGHSDRVKTVAISPDGKYIVSGSYDKSIKVWDLPSGREIHTFEGNAFIFELEFIFFFNNIGTIFVVVVVVVVVIIILHCPIVC